MTREQAIEEMNVAAQMIIDLLDEHSPGTSVLVCSSDMHVTSQARYANGTQQWTVKPRADYV